MNIGRCCKIDAKDLVTFDILCNIDKTLTHVFAAPVWIIC